MEIIQQNKSNQFIVVTGNGQICEKMLNFNNSHRTEIMITIPTITL